MTAQAFDTEITETDGALVGPWRQPRQMLQAQTYDAHASIHDDATAQKLGSRAAPSRARRISARSDHGRPLSVLPQAEARRHHGELALLFGRGQSFFESLYGAR